MCVCHECHKADGDLDLVCVAFSDEREKEGEVECEANARDDTQEKHLHYIVVFSNVE